MLTLYRNAIRLRRDFQDEPGLTWLGENGNPVLDFDRGSRLRCVVNLSDRPTALPGTPTLWSGTSLPGDRLPPDTAAWFVR